MEFVGVRVGSKDPRSLILELRLSEWLTVQVDSLGGGWKSETARVAIYGISRILITLQLICTKATKNILLARISFQRMLAELGVFFIVYDFLFWNCTIESRKQKKSFR